jgi:hypothetical protein
MNICMLSLISRQVYIIIEWVNEYTTPVAYPSEDHTLAGLDTLRDSRVIGRDIAVQYLGACRYWFVQHREIIFH